MKTLLGCMLLVTVAIGGALSLGGCADSSAQLDRLAPYRPTSTPAATQSPDFAKPKP